MGISICIPRYQDDPSRLFSYLMHHVQYITDTRRFTTWQESGFEVIVCDDASPEPPAIPHPNIRLLRNEQNQGRVATRHRLAEAAKFDYLLFLDADSLPVKPDFLETYQQVANQGVGAAAGGTLYFDERPTDKNQLLRWHYGRARESRTLAQRRQEGNRGLAFNNLLIRKDLFFSMRLPPLGYGHEDTLLGYRLLISGVTIEHVSAPVYHIGLETNRAFLQKSLESARTLAGLAGYSLPVNFVRLSHAYARLQEDGTMWLLPVIQKISPFLNQWVLFRLPGYLRALDLLKLAEYGRQIKRQ